MEQELLRLKQEAEEALAHVADPVQLEAFRVKYLGRKGGLLTGILRQLGKVATEDRPRLGQLANDVKQGVESRFEAKKELLTVAERGSGSGATDYSLPGRYLPFGKLHPVTQVMEEICSIFEGLGFAVAEGPDVETD
jgi:phenylalanyl-tRNA synthetase alpha chain